jgi:hypothetical protein
MRWNLKPLTVVSLLAAASLAWATTGDGDSHMKKMSEMHEKIINAKTVEERRALMDEHMKVMHDGKRMMKGMGSKEHKHGMGGMKGTSDDRHCDDAGHQR